MCAVICDIKCVCDYVYMPVQKSFICNGHKRLQESTVSYPVPFLMMLIVSLTEEGKPGILEKSAGIFPSAEISGKHLPSTNIKGK